MVNIPIACCWKLYVKMFGQFHVLLNIISNPAENQSTNFEHPWTWESLHKKKHFFSKPNLTYKSKNIAVSLVKTHRNNIKNMDRFHPSRKFSVFLLFLHLISTFFPAFLQASLGSPRAGRQLPSRAFVDLALLAVALSQGVQGTCDATVPGEAVEGAHARGTKDALEMTCWGWDWGCWFL